MSSFDPSLTELFDDYASISSQIQEEKKIGGKPTVSIPCEIVKETAKAILLKVWDSEDCIHAVWFPLSTVHEIHHSTTENEKTRVVVDKWIADKNLPE